jgi:hypothetical protein
LEALLTLKRLAGSPDPLQYKKLEVALKEKLETIQRRIDELEVRKKKIADSMDEQGSKISKIKALAEQQNTIRRETNLVMLARHLGLLENSKRVSTLYPCIVDYAINIGLKNVGEQWQAFLNTTGDLRSDISLRTGLDQQLSPLASELSWSSLTEDFWDDRVT